MRLKAPDERQKPPPVRKSLAAEVAPPPPPKPPPQPPGCGHGWRCWSIWSQKTSRLMRAAQQLAQQRTDQRAAGDVEHASVVAAAPIVAADRFDLGHLPAVGLLIRLRLLDRGQRAAVLPSRAARAGARRRRRRASASAALRRAARADPGAGAPLSITSVASRIAGCSPRVIAARRPNASMAFLPFASILSSMASTFASASASSARARGGFAFVQRGLLHLRQPLRLRLRLLALALRVLGEPAGDLLQHRVVGARLVVPGEARHPAVHHPGERTGRVRGGAVAALPEVLEQLVLLVRLALLESGRSPPACVFCSAPTAICSARCAACNCC